MRSETSVLATAAARAHLRSRGNVGEASPSLLLLSKQARAARTAQRVWLVSTGPHEDMMLER
jgi:hypothetical protein